MTAFAFGRLTRVNVFHHSPSNSVTLEHPLIFYQALACNGAQYEVVLYYTVLCVLSWPLGALQFGYSKRCNQPGPTNHPLSRSFECRMKAFLTMDPKAQVEESTFDRRRPSKLSGVSV
jgi:hypothetical protein